MNKLPYTLVASAFALTLTVCVSFADPITTHHESSGNRPDYGLLSNTASTVLAGDMAPGAFPIGEDIAPISPSSDGNKSLITATGKVETANGSAHPAVMSDISVEGTDTSLDATDAGATSGGDSSGSPTPSSDSTVISLTSSSDSSAPTGFDTITTVSLAPEPSSMLVTGIVLVGLASGRKKRFLR